jgi:hypothetical protein
MIISKQLFERVCRYAIPGLFLIFALANYAGGLSNKDPGLGGDSLHTVARALAGLEPELYESDFIFSDPHDYSFYINFNVILLQAIELAGFTDISLAYNILNSIAIFVYLFGYYLLGRAVTGQPVLSAFFAAACAISVYTLRGHFWGLYHEPQARVLFASALPYLMLVAISGSFSLSRWVAVFIVAGGVAWLHPASGPLVALAIMGGMIAMALGKYPLSQVLIRAFIAGLFFLAVFGPNLWMYMSGTLKANEGSDTDIVYELLPLIWTREFIDASVGIPGSLGRMFAGIRSLLIPLTAIGALIIFLRGTSRDIDLLRFFCVFLAVILMGSLGIPFVDQIVALWLDRTPAQIDLIRCIRYIFPVMLLLTFWGASRLTKAQCVSAGISVLIFGYWFVAKDAAPSWPQNKNALKGMKCWSKGKAVCPRKSSPAKAELLEVVREQPRGTLFVSNSDALGLELRSFARVSLAFSGFDTGWLAYSNQAKLLKNADNLRNYVEIRKMKDQRAKTVAWIDFARAVHADYIVFNEDISQMGLPNFAKIIFTNSAGTVVAIHSPKL